MSTSVFRSTLFSFAAFALACNVSLAQKPLTYSDSLFFYRVLVDTNTLVSDYQECSTKSITVLRAKDQKPVQTIKLDEDAFPCSWTEDDYFVVEDLNFDGHNDIRLMQSMGARGNTSYLFWLYDISSKQFVRDTSLEMLTNISVDAKEKTLASYWSVGCCEYGTNVYKYIDGKLTTIEEETMQLDYENEKEYVYILRKRENGEMKTVEEKRMPRKEVEEESDEDDDNE